MMYTAKNKPTRKPLLFVHYGDNWIRGSERCLIDLLNHIDKDAFEPVLWCNNEALAHEAQKIGIPVYVSNFTLLFGERTPKWDVVGYSKLIKEGLRIIDKHKISLVHANSGAPLQWLNLVSRARKLPLVLHLHARYPLRERITLGLHHASMAVGVSQPVVDQLLNDGVRAQRCQVIPNGIDVDRLLNQPVQDIRHTYGLPSGAFVAVSVCSLIHRKGVDLLIEATRQLHELKLPFHLVVIGEGPDRGLLEQQIEENGLQEFVHLVGESDDVVGLMRGGADLYMSGAREEVFGLTLAEAGLARLPVIAPCVGGIPSVIKHQNGGLLVSPNNAHALANAAFHLCVNPERRIELGQQGYNHVIENFGITTYTHRFEQLYTTLLNDPDMMTRWMSHWQISAPVKASLKFMKNYAVADSAGATQ